MKAHEIDYRIIGHDMQLVEVELDPGETVIAEAGAMTYMDQQITFATKMGDGSDPDQGVFGKLFSACPSRARRTGFLSMPPKRGVRSGERTEV